MDKLKELVALGWKIKNEIVSHCFLVQASKDGETISVRSSVLDTAIVLLHEKCIRFDEFKVKEMEGDNGL